MSSNVAYIAHSVFVDLSDCLYLLLDVAGNLKDGPIIKLDLSVSFYGHKQDSERSLW